MRKITPKAVVQFVSLTGLEFAISIGFSFGVVSPCVPSAYRGVLTIVLSIFLFYALAIFGFRLLQKIAPVPIGEIFVQSIGEHRAFLYMLHFILLFNPLLFSRLLPFPLLGLLLKLLGIKMGKDSYCAGIVMDPQFVNIGESSLIGNDAMLIAHVIEGDNLAFQPICIGNNVTVGARAIIMAGVTIEDGAIVGVQAVVRKGSHIKRNETWVGCPARRVDV